MARGVVAGLSLLGIASLSLAIFCARCLVIPGAGAFPGTTFGGYLPAKSLPFGDWLEQERIRLGGKAICVTSNGFAMDVAAGRLGIEVDVAEMLQLARRQTRHGSVIARIQRALAARRALTDYAWVTRFDRERARATLRKLAPWVERAPVDAELDLVHRRQIHARSGVRLDVDATLDHIASHRAADLSSISLVLRELLPRVRDEDLLGIDVSRVLSRFETDFHNHAGSRAVNIRVAARALNGQVLAPSGNFSFNRIVGPRVEARGYREAPVIVDDELEPGVGGGVCQVATTLHGAAVLGGLEVLERRSHSRPSGYAPLGLDATVIDGSVDLRLRNPYPTPVAILVSFPQRFRIRVELLGAEPPGKFEHSYAVVKRHEYYRRIITKAEITPGSHKRKQKGNWGYDIISTVVLHRQDGSMSRKQYRSRYWPVPEVFWIGSDTDIASLPPLTEGASGAQLDGRTILGTISPLVAERSEKSASMSDPQEQ